MISSDRVGAESVTVAHLLQPLDRSAAQTAQTGPTHRGGQPHALCAQLGHTLMHLVHFRAKSALLEPTPPLLVLFLPPSAPDAPLVDTRQPQGLPMQTHA